MSNATQSGKKDGEAKVQISDFVVAKLDGRFRRFQDTGVVPEKATDRVTLESLDKMTMDAIAEMYGDVTGQIPKNFKTKAIAVESLVYQLNKLPMFDPSAAVAPTTVVKSKGSTASTTPAAPKEKTKNTFELLAPANSKEVLQGLAPQARELVLIMTDVAQETGSATFGEDVLQKKLAIPEVGARLNTRQDPNRILQYYKGKLIGAGLIRVS